MLKIIKPPSKIPETSKKKIFLAGTIDNGISNNWQAMCEKKLSAMDIVILNPRREEWDASWEQSIDNPVFKAQVEWELAGLHCADIVMMYFAPGSQSPITLLELGLMAHSGKLFIVCPDGYWRKGNVEVVANQYGLPLYGTIDECLQAVVSAM